MPSSTTAAWKGLTSYIGLGLSHVSAEVYSLHRYTASLGGGKNWVIECFNIRSTDAVSTRVSDTKMKSAAVDFTSEEAPNAPSRAKKT